MALNVQGVVNGLNPAFNAMREEARSDRHCRFAGRLWRRSECGRNPGFVKTPLTARNNFPMPFLMECDAACRRLCDGLELGGFEIRFPTRLALIARAINVLPYPLYFGAGRAVSGRERLASVQRL